MDSGVIGLVRVLAAVSEPSITGVHSSSRPISDAQQPGLALAALPEQHEVVAGDQRPFDLRQHGVLETEQTGPDLSAPSAEAGEQVLPEFLLDAALPMAGGAQLADGAGQIIG